MTPLKSSRAPSAKLARETEKKTKKQPPAPIEFAQVLAQAPIAPLRLPPAPLAIARLVEPRLTTTAIATATAPAQPPKRPAMTSALDDHRPAQVQAQSVAPAAATPSAPREVAEAPPASFVAHLPEDPALRVNLSAQGAMMSIQTADAGDLSLYLRVRQGAAELRIEGAAASRLERHTDELRVALATEGIVLHRLELQTQVSAAGEAQSAGFSSTTDFERDQRAPPEPLEQPELATLPAAAPPAVPSPARAEAGLHVRA